MKKLIHALLNIVAIIIITLALAIFIKVFLFPCHPALSNIHILTEMAMSTEEKAIIIYNYNAQGTIANEK